MKLTIKIAFSTLTIVLSSVTSASSQTNDSLPSADDVVAKLLIIIQSHSRSVFPVDTEMYLLPFPLFVAHRPEASCLGEVPDLRRNDAADLLAADG